MKVNGAVFQNGMHDDSPEDADCLIFGLNKLLFRYFIYYLYIPIHDSVHKLNKPRIQAITWYILEVLRNNHFLPT